MDEIELARGGEGDRTMMSICNQSAPRRTMRSASEARLAKSDESIDGAIFAAAMSASRWVASSPDWWQVVKDFGRQMFRSVGA